MSFLYLTQGKVTYTLCTHRIVENLILPLPKT